MNLFARHKWVIVVVAVLIFGTGWLVTRGLVDAQNKASRIAQLQADFGQRRTVMMETFHKRAEAAVEFINATPPTVLPTEDVQKLADAQIATKGLPLETQTDFAAYDRVQSELSSRLAELSTKLEGAPTDPADPAVAAYETWKQKWRALTEIETNVVQARKAYHETAVALKVATGPVPESELNVPMFPVESEVHKISANADTEASAPAPANAANQDASGQ